MAERVYEEKDDDHDVTTNNNNKMNNHNHVSLVLADVSAGMLQAAVARGGLNTTATGVWLAMVQVYGKVYLFHFAGVTVSPVDAEFAENYPNKRIIEFGPTDKTEAELDAYLNSAEVKRKFGEDKFNWTNNNSSHFANDLLLNFFQFPDGVPAYVMNQTDELAQTSRALFQNIRTLFTTALQAVEPELRQAQGAAREIVQKTARAVQEEVNNELREGANEVRGEVNEIENGFAELMQGLRTGGMMLRAALGEQMQEANRRRQRGTRRRGCGTGPDMSRRGEARMDGEAPWHRHNNHSRHQNVGNNVEAEATPALRSDMVEFIDKTFPEEDELPVAEKIKSVLRKEGYVQLSELSSTSEEELLAMGLKRGWAKRIVASLEAQYK